MFVVYILYSPAHGKDYVGYTSDLIGRFHSHNTLATKGYTMKYRPWVVVHVEFYDTKIEAMKREKCFKSGRGLYMKKAIIAEFLGVESSGSNPSLYK